MSKTRQPRSEVFLTAFDDHGSVLNDLKISYERYYEDPHPLIDDDDYRAANRVRRVMGRIYNSAGELQSEFDNLYDEAGAITKSKAVHADGTVTEL